MPVAIYPGTFDPITFGHIDIAKRAASIFRKVYAVIADNPQKNPVFDVQERLAMAKLALADLPNVEVIRYRGLIVNCLKELNATAIIRGLRALSDFEYEFQMALTNRNMFEAAETVFLMPNEKFIYLNSTMVKQIARLGGDVRLFVPEHVSRELKKKWPAGPEVITA